VTSNLVDVFIAGVQKGGTTSLYLYFCDHPELIGPRVKETHFFDDETIDWSTPDYRILHEFYPTDIAKGRLFDATPVYVFWPPSVARIKEYNRNARLVVLFRDPIERAFSHWCMEYGRGAETLPFASAIREGRRRLANLSPTDPAQRVYSYVERGFYARQALRLIEHFLPEQLLFLRSEDLRDRHDEVLTRIASFLGISSFGRSMPRRDFGRPNGLPPSSLTDDDITYLRDLFSSDLQRFATVTHVDVSHWLTVRTDLS
jgi:hypothetical protein